MKKTRPHSHLPADVKYSAWLCKPDKPRIDNIVKDRRKTTCPECLATPLKCGPLSFPVRIAQ